jgi:hypothetical protein
VAQIMRNLGEARWSSFFYEREERREAVEQGFRSASVWLAEEREGRPFERLPWPSRRDAGATPFEPPVEVFLEASYRNVEAENLGGEGMLASEVFGTPDAPLPGSDGHPPIMGLRCAVSKY